MAREPPLDPFALRPEQARGAFVFFSYAHQDKRFRDRLEDHLSNLKYRGLITTWHDREIRAGEEWMQQIDIHLDKAHIILLLISADFMASDYCYSVEMKRALERHEQSKADVIPILLRPVLYTDAPFAKLQMLPTNRKPIIRWRDRDSAFFEIACGIERAAQKYSASLPEPPQQQYWQQYGSPPLSSATPQAISTPDAVQAARDTPSGGASPGSQRRLSPGTILSRDRYKIEKLIAAGGTGAVYRAEDTELEDACTVKEMLDEFQTDTERVQAVEWFKREAKLLLTLNHPCIPRVRGFFVEGGRHYLVMDFIEGRTLGEVLEREGNIVGLNGARGVSEARARSWGQQVCSVLSYLHRQNPPIIFRDLKPSNIMVTDRDEIKLIDFGIARTFQSQHQATIIMTLGYAPPEQLLGSPEPRSDLYALGSTLHKVLTRHDAANNKPSIYSFPPIRTLRPDVSPGFEQVVMKTLSASLEQRWANAAEMERAILSLPPPGPVPPQIPATQQVVPRPANPQTPPAGISRPGVPPGVVQSTTGVTGPAGGLINAALGHLNTGRIEAAYDAVRQAFTLEPNNALVHRVFGQVFARRQPPSPDQAIQAYTRSLQLNPNDAETHKLLGDVWLFLRRQPIQAIPAYMQSLRLKTDDFEAHQRLAECYEQTNAARKRRYYEEAIEAYERALRRNPSDGDALRGMGNALYALGYYDQALNAFTQAIHLGLSPAAYAGLGDVFARLKRYSEAVAAYEKAIELDPTVTLNYDDFMRSLRALGRKEEAEQVHARVKQLGYENEE